MPFVKRLRRIVRLDRLPVPPRRGAAGGFRQEHQIDRLVDRAFDRLQRHHAVLHDGRLDPSDNPQPVGAVPREIETSLEPRQRREARGFGDRRPRAAVRNDIDMPPGFRDVRNRDRETPGAARRSFARSSSRNRLRIGKLKLRARQRTRLLLVEPPARLAHIGSQAPGAQRRLGDAEDIAGDAPPRAAPRCRRRARSRRPWRGRRTPPPTRRISLGTARSPTPISRKLSSMSRQNRSNSCWPRGGTAPGPCRGPWSIAAAAAPDAARSCPAGRPPCPARRNPR